jgi:hypothetical protein
MHWAYDREQQYPPSPHYWTEGRKEQWARSAALAYMRDHPGVTLRRSILKFADFWGLERELIAGFAQRLYSPPLWVAALAAIAVTVSYPALLLSGVLGAFLTPPRDRRTHVLLLLVVAFICGLHTIVFGHSRYHLPLIPLLALYAARVLTSGAWRELFVNARRAALPCALGCVFVTIWAAREIFVRDAERISSLLAALR